MKNTNHDKSPTKALGDEMDKKLEEKMNELERLVVTGHSSDGAVTVHVDGRHQVLDIAVDTQHYPYTTDQKLTCSLIAEAVNDGLYRIDLNIETELSTIQYEYTGKAINAALGTEKVKNKYKKLIVAARGQ